MKGWCLILGEREYLISIGIDKKGDYSEEDSYIIPLLSSNEYGKIFSILDNTSGLEILQENQVVTEQGSSLLYESEDGKFLLNLIADFDNNIYQLICNDINNE